MMQKSRFEYTGYGSAFRAGGANSGAQSDWWNSAVRETLRKTAPKNLTISDRRKNSDLQSMVSRGFCVGQLGLFS